MQAMERKDKFATYTFDQGLTSRTYTNNKKSTIRIKYINISMTIWNKAKPHK